MKTKSGATVEKRGAVVGAEVHIEPPFPAGTVLGASVEFKNGAAWKRVW